MTITGAATVNQTFSLADTAFSIVIADGYTLNFTDNVTMTTGVANTITVESGGTLNVSLLSQDQTAAMAGDIKVKTGANVTYHGRGETSYTVLGDNGAMITLGTGAEATMNLADAVLSLNTGAATVNAYSTNDDVNALLVLSDGLLPLNVTINEGSTLTVPESSNGLNIPNGGSLTVNGTVNVSDKLTIHSTASLSGAGTVNVTGEDVQLIPSGSDSIQVSHGMVEVANINLASGGKIQLASERAESSMPSSTITGGVPVKDEGGNVTYQQHTGITVLDADGKELTASYNTVAAALQADGAVDIYLNNSETAYQMDTSANIGKNQAIHVMDGATLNAVVASGVSSNYPLLTHFEGGSIVVENGGTVKLPESVNDTTADNLKTWIGTEKDSTARLKLTIGTATFTFGDGVNKAGTLMVDGDAEIPEGQESVTHLNWIPMGVEITDSRTVTVNGILQLISGRNSNGSLLTVNGALDVKNASGLSMGEDAKIEVASTGTFNMPQMSKAQMGDVMGDIIINGGAKVQYHTYPYTIVGGNNPLITLSDGASATLNVSNAENGPIKLILDQGTATVVGSNDSLLAALVSTDSPDKLVPFDITIANGALLTVPTGKNPGHSPER